MNVGGGGGVEWKFSPEGFPGSSATRELGAPPLPVQETQGLISGLGRSSGERNGSILLQYSCLENSMDREAWRAITHEVTKSQARLSLHAHTFSP